MSSLREASLEGITLQESTQVVIYNGNPSKLGLSDDTRLEREKKIVDSYAPDSDFDYHASDCYPTHE